MVNNLGDSIEGPLVILEGAAYPTLHVCVCLFGGPRGGTLHDRCNFARVRNLIPSAASLPGGVSFEWVGQRLGPFRGAVVQVGVV